MPQAQKVLVVVQVRQVKAFLPQVGDTNTTLWVVQRAKPSNKKIESTLQMKKLHKRVAEHYPKHALSKSL